MARSDIIILSAFILAFSQADGRCLSLDLDPSSGRFHVNIQNERWFSSGAVFFRANGEHYTTTDGSLTLIEVVEDCPDLRGVDSLGAFSTTILRYSNPEGQEMVGSIKIYDCSIVFDQTFPTLLEVFYICFLELHHAFFFNRISNRILQVAIQMKSSRGSQPLSSLRQSKTYRWDMLTGCHFITWLDAFASFRQLE